MKLSLKLIWLYPDLMSTYGDRGNVLVLLRRCLWRGIEIQVKPYQQKTKAEDLLEADLFFMGGAQDRQQKLVSLDLSLKKREFLKQKIEAGTPGLFICGAYQFLGHYYQPAEGKKIPGLGLLDLYTKHPGESKPRAIGDLIVRWQKTLLVGFENHGGRTYLGRKVKPFAQVLFGQGNNGEDQTEGAVYKNVIGSYMHGPLLSKNPELADWLIKKALELKYQKTVVIQPLNDKLELEARYHLLRRYNFG